MTFSYGPERVLHEIDLTVAPGHRVGVIGPNGTGKSTLLRLLAGQLTPEAGIVTLSPATATVGLLPQEPDRNPDETVLDFIARRTGVAEATAQMESATEAAMRRLDVVDKPWEAWELRFEIGAGERSGDVVADLQSAVVDRGEFRLGPVDLHVGWAERVAILGANGAGKSTLLDLILQRIQPDSGTAHLGSGVVVGEMSQRRDRFATAETLLDVVLAATGLDLAEARSLLAKFGLGKDQVNRPSASLSPGDRTRANLALFMVEGVNLLVLDEPTNHLDLAAIEQLEQALDRYVGTLLLVTHDRALLDRVTVTRRLEVADGRVTEVAPQ